MSEQDFLDKQGRWFHIKLLKYYYLLIVDKEENADDDILYFSFQEGEYSIRYIDLKIKADEETTLFLEENGPILNNDINGPTF